MKKRRIIGLILAVAMCFNLSGCSLFTVDTNELLSPPALTGELAPIAKALQEKLGSGYALKYPSGGNYHSAVVQNDINGDGVFEALALYSTTDGDTAYMNLEVLTNDNGLWNCAASAQVVAGGVEMIDFCDLNADGDLEVLVGFEIYGATEKQLAVYSFSGKALSQRMLQRYTHFLCEDLNNDEKNEVFIINFNPAENTNIASLYGLTEEGIEEISSCLLDTNIESVNAPLYSTLSNGTPAVYIDEVKGAGAITEVVYIEKGKLVNPLLSVNTGQNILTLRSATIPSKDINGDGITEIPIQSVLPSVFYKNHETLYYTDWYSFNGSVLTKQVCTIMNFNDGYYLTVPNKFIGNISVLKDIDRKLRVIYRYDAETETIGEEIARLQAVEERRWDSEDYDKKGLSELARSGGYVFAYKISGEGEEKETLTQQFIESFKLID